jgi:hypothetical protein
VSSQPAGADPATEPVAPESVISSAPRWQLVEVTLVDRAVTFEAVHADASVAAERTKEWWRELQVQLVAGSGLCWASASLSPPASSMSTVAATPRTWRPDLWWSRCGRTRPIRALV